jgi:hypothetical protein
MKEKEEDKRGPCDSLNVTPWPRASGITRISENKIGCIEVKPMNGLKSNLNNLLRTIAKI